MIIVYIVVVAFVTALLLSIPLLPFWKVWLRIKSHHPDIWRSAGPFEVMSMIASPGLAGIFIDVLIRMENDKDLLGRDPFLRKWVHIAMEVVRMMPRTFMSQIGYFLVFLYFTNLLTTILLTPFGHH